MSFREKSTWVMLIGLLGAMALYGAGLLEIALPIAAGVGVLTAVIGFVVFAVAGHILIAATAGRDADRGDERDAEVDRKTDRISEATLSAVILGILTYGLAREDTVLVNIAFFGLFGAASLKFAVMAVLYRMRA